MSNFYVYLKFCFAVIVLILFSSCSNLPSVQDNAIDAIAGDEDDYIEEEKVIFPTAKNKNSNAILALSSTNYSTPTSYLKTSILPRTELNGIKLKTNIMETWLEIPSDQSKKIWQDAQNFLVSLGFKIRGVDIDSGIIHTEYKSRLEVVGKELKSPLSYVLNSWRPELVEGIYDRITVRFQFDKITKKSRLYFYDHVLYKDNDGDIDIWKAKTYSPEYEAEIIYQAMLFWGFSKNKAKHRIRSMEYLVTIDNSGTKKFNAIALQGSYRMAKNYTSALIYRAGWKIIKVDEARNIFTIEKNNLNVFNNNSKAKIDIPNIVNIAIEQQDANIHLLKVSVPENKKVLKAKQKIYIFKSLGFIN